MENYGGGGGWIRTNVGVSQQIYSLPPLTTRAPLRGEPQIMVAEQRLVKRTTSQSCERWLDKKAKPPQNYILDVSDHLRKLVAAVAD